MPRDLFESPQQKRTVFSSLSEIWATGWLNPSRASNFFEVLLSAASELVTQNPQLTTRIHKFLDPTGIILYAYF